MHQEQLAKWLLSAAVSLGSAALALKLAGGSFLWQILAILKARPVSDRFSMGLAAFLGFAFWIGLIAAGLLPGTDYGFLDDPVLGNIREPELLGITIYPNVVAGAITIAIAVTGY